MKIRAFAVPIVATGLALTAAACGSSSSSKPAASHSAASSTSAAPSSAAAASPSTAPSSSTTGKDFGPACSQVPSSGPGSFSGMSTAPVATAASHNPILSTLVAAVKKAGLVDTLNSAKSITVFAPDNAAFSKIPSSELNKLLADKTELIKLLEYHVAAGRYTPAQLASGTPIKTLEGATVTPSKSGSTYEINGVPVVCGNVQTANATVYIISGVLTQVLTGK